MTQMKARTSGRPSAGEHLDIAPNKVASFRKERRIYPAGHSITRVRCRMNAAFRRSVEVHLLPPSPGYGAAAFALAPLRAKAGLRTNLHPEQMGIATEVEVG